MLYLYLIDLGEALVVKSFAENRGEQTFQFNLKHHFHYEAVPSWVKSALAAHLREYREAWKLGFGTAIAARLQKQYEDSLKSQEATSTAMIHINRDALAVRNFLAGKIKTSRIALPTASKTNDGFAHGQNTGNEVNLSSNRLPKVPSSRLLGA
jgi:hypothetical protein